MQAMIFAAGLGTRLKPLTDRIPKALVSVGGEPLLKRVIFQLKDAGFTRIVVNVHHFSKQIIDYLRDNKNFGMDIRISDESEKLLETGGGIKKAWPFFDQTEPILIHNVDILSNVDLKKFYQMESKELVDDSLDSMKEKAPLAARLLVSERKTKRYLLFDDTMRLVGWTNIETGEVKSPYPDLNPEDYKMYAFSGIHMVAPSLFPLMENEPDKFPIMDFYLKHCDKVRIEGYVKNDQKPFELAKFLLHEKNEKLIQRINYSMTADSLKIKKLVVGSVKVEPQIPLFITYYTLYPFAKGVVSYPDVYGFDGVIFEQLKKYL